MESLDLMISILFSVLVAIGELLFLIAIKNFLTLIEFGQIDVDQPFFDFPFISNLSQYPYTFFLLSTFLITIVRYLSIFISAYSASLIVNDTVNNSNFFCNSFNFF